MRFLESFVFMTEKVGFKELLIVLGFQSEGFLSPYYVPWCFAVGLVAAPESNILIISCHPHDSLVSTLVDTQSAAWQSFWSMALAVLQSLYIG